MESVLALVQAPDGDFGILAQLAHAASDPQSLQTMVEYLRQTPIGEQAFHERPRLQTIDLHQLQQLPPETLGYAYAQHMQENNLKPILAGDAHSDSDFLQVHITETHDIWHVLTGSDTSILGEIQLEAFYVAQLYASRFWTALLAKNLLKAAIDNIEVSTQYLDALSHGWRLAKQAQPLFGVDWSQWWDTPLEDVRATFNLAVNGYSSGLLEQFVVPSPQQSP